ncbi:MAG: FtsX-like permease family protein [Rhodothermales bacterium]|nr:FtsX-like permease family protein [Rhodothermales bacterium]MBO6781368.1 FtsX-like permease family protein [Rhodothermales bacterium]
MIRLLAIAAGRYFAGHRLQLVMSVVGIAVGVAMITGVDLAVSSANRAFELSAETVAGRTTHYLTGADGTVESEVYRTLRVRHGIRDVAPVAEGYVRTAAGTFRLLGIDPLAATAPGRSLPGFPEPGRLMVGSDAVVLSAGGLAVLAGTDSVTVDAAGRSFTLAVAGVVRPDEEAGRQGWSDLMVADVATAQRVLGLGDQLSRIDLITTDDGAREIEALAGPGIRLERPESRSNALGQMTAAFETNLQALSYLALVVGMFLIYNIMSFSVVQRRPVYSRLRATGVSRTLVQGSVLMEAAALGLVGSVVGLGLGAALGEGLVRLVTRAINDLYFVVNVREVGLDGWQVGKSLVVGLAASLGSAWVPARAAASVPAADALRRSDEEDRFAAGIAGMARWGAVLGGLSIVVLVLPAGVAGGYLGLLLLIVSFALTGPALVRGLAAGARRFGGGLPVRMAVGGIREHLSRTSIATVALAVSVAAAVGVGVMVDSFRGTVQEWLGTTLRADLYIRAPGSVLRLGGGVVAPEAIAVMRGMEGVEASYGVRRVDVETSDGPVALVVIESGPQGRAAYRFTETTVDDPWAAFAGGDVFVSEPYAFRTGTGAGDTLEVQTETGPQVVRAVAEYVDYGSDMGVVLMERAAYERSFDDTTYNGIALYLEPGVDPEAMVTRVREETAGIQGLIVSSNRALRDASLEIFDRTFAITWVLRALALIVAVIGVISALAAIQLERSWEFAVQRAVGLRRGALQRVMLLQSGLMGAFAGLLSIPLGIALAAGLVYVINRRSFGWTLDFSVDPVILLQAVVVSIVAALAAGWIPARAASRASLASRLKGPHA